MKPVLLLLYVFLFAGGCLSKPQDSRNEIENGSVGTANLSYAVLLAPPVELLDQMATSYKGNNEQWRIAWKLDNSSIPIDGQRTVRLLEIACYADIVCHSVEYPLRVATHEYIKENLYTSDVRYALRWIRTSYKSSLPLEGPGDESGDFNGMVIQAMNTRLREFANELLQ